MTRQHSTVVHLATPARRGMVRPGDSAGRMPGGAATVDLAALGRAGSRAAAQLPPPTSVRTPMRRLRRRTRQLRAELTAAMARTYTNAAVREWLTDNARLLASAEGDAREFLWSARDYPAVPAAEGSVPRVGVLVHEYLECVGAVGFSEATLTAFLRGAQATSDLQLGELWAARGGLMLALLDRVVAAVALEDDAGLADAIETIRQVSEANWTQLFAAASVVDLVLATDPAGAYARMDAASRDNYRHVVSRLAKHGRLSERQVADAAVAFARDTAASAGHTPEAADRRRMHVGYYLVDEGLGRLQAAAGYRAPWLDRIKEALVSHPTMTYLGGVAVVTLTMVVMVLWGFDVPGPALVACALLLLPVMQAAVEFVNALVPAVARPKLLPKLDFAAGIPVGCKTMVAVPALLIDERHVRELVMDLEIRYLANRDRQLHFALLTDWVDADTAERPDDEALLSLAVSLVENLNARYGAPGRTPFYLLHRHRVHNASEGRWMGWERKRGKLLDLNRLLRGAFDAFPVKVGHLDILPRIRYVIALDSDTQLPLDAARRLVGAMAHPLSHAVIAPQTNQVVEGYGVLQPRIGISTQSAARSWLARLLSGQTGFDIYTRAVSDPYQDLFGEGIFTGKGIYDVDVFHTVLEHRFPENALLSHDLVEGMFARVGLVSDIEMIDDYPTHFSAYSRRKHRWMRGDWQILRWLMPWVPDGQGRLMRNHSRVISRWQILDNLRRSLFEPAMLLLLLSSWFILPGRVAAWTVLAVALLLLPAYGGLTVAVLRAPWGRTGLVAWCGGALRTLARQHLMAVLTLTFLLHDALLALDAIFRSLARVHVTRQRLLEWETAAQARETGGRRRPADAYLAWSPAMVAAMGAALAVVRPDALWAAGPVLALWLCARPFAGWLSGQPASASLDVTADDEAWLRMQGWRMWRYFREFSTEHRHWMVPDHVHESGAAAERLSPTNLGFLLNARVAAVHLGQLTVPEFARDTQRTLDGLQALPFERGHLLNWSDLETGRALAPWFVSTVDSGNLVACLWTVKQAALAFARGEAPASADVLWSGVRDLARVLASTTHPDAQALAERVLRVGDDEWAASLAQLEAVARHVSLGFAATDGPPDEEARWWVDELVARLAAARAWRDSGLSPDLGAALVALADRIDQLVSAMDFRFLYHPRKKTLSVGYDAASGALETSTYDLLASEARIAAFVAIAKGDVPQDSWLHLGRAHVAPRGHRVLASWTGTMFEYLMPALWMRHQPRTIMRDSLVAIVRLQQAFTRRRGLPWGISESGYVVEPARSDAEHGYAPFGIPSVSRSPRANGRLVVAPYASYLAMLVDPQASVHNLRRMEAGGWAGSYGLYEAVDFSSGSPAPVRIWMAHHQGMSLLAVCNLLCDQVLQRHFHAEPQVLAAELLLDERVPVLEMADLEEWLVPPRPVEQQVV
jgi:cyclic beta-1,2-glucan synthetase